MIAQKDLIQYERKIKETAVFFIENKCTMIEAEKLLGVPHSTICWWFIHKLPYIDRSLYWAVRNRIIYNIKNKRRYCK